MVASNSSPSLIDSLLGGRYGFALWAREAIAEHVAANETRIVVTSAKASIRGELLPEDGNEVKIFEI